MTPRVSLPLVVALALLVACARPPGPLPPTEPVQDSGRCPDVCSAAQSACPAPRPIDVCVEICAQAAPDLETPLDELAVTLTCR